MTATNDRLEAFRSALEAKLSKGLIENFSSYRGVRITLKLGVKNARIVKQTIYGDGRVEDHGSAYGFVDLITGDILMAAGWRGPAKHARGSIHADDLGLSCCGDYGVAYLR